MKALVEEERRLKKKKKTGMKQKHHPKEEAATPTQAAIAPSATKLRTQKRNQKRKMNKMLKLNTKMSMTEPQSQTTPISTENQNHHSFSTLSQSIESIRKLSSLVSQFTSQWDNLKSHLSTILLSIDSLNSQQQQQRLLPQNPSLENNPNSLPNFNSLCIRMDAAELRKSLLAHHEENETVIKRLLFFALRDAPDPIRLVLDFIYGNGVERVYPETFGASPVQKAVVTVLMIFLQLGPWGMEEHHVEDAERIVTLWMERIVAYGGIAEAAATTDCLNLLLFLCSFGVPGDNVVNVEDLAALVRWSGAVKLREYSAGGLVQYLWRGFQPLFLGSAETESTLRPLTLFLPSDSSTSTNRLVCCMNSWRLHLQTCKSLEMKLIILLKRRRIRS